MRSEMADTPCPSYRGGQTSAELNAAFRSMGSTIMDAAGPFLVVVMLAPHHLVASTVLFSSCHGQAGFHSIAVKRTP